MQLAKVIREFRAVPATVPGEMAGDPAHDTRPVLGGGLHCEGL
jgi:hypothetical protein